jgi:hypothetical protein
VVSNVEGVVSVGGSLGTGTLVVPGPDEGATVDAGGLVVGVIVVGADPVVVVVVAVLVVAGFIVVVAAGKDDPGLDVVEAIDDVDSTETCVSGVHPIGGGDDSQGTEISEPLIQAKVAYTTTLST